MESYQPFSPSFKTQTAMAESGKLSPEPTDDKTNNFSSEQSMEGFIGYLDVFVHQAREVHNICIYHKQDVYAKLCLTSDPDAAISTKTINGGGRNPVFNDNLRLKVRTIESSLKCEIWMLSRVKNYLEDQLLGFALVPLSDVVVTNGKLAQEFSLSSTDLFHSPAGFVQLSLSYVGSPPEVISISPRQAAIDSVSNDLIPCEYEKIEFPDLKVVKENRLMVSEYFGVPGNTIETQSPESLITTEDDNFPDDDAGMRVVESFSTDNSTDSVGFFRNDTPLSSDSMTDSSVVLPTTPQSTSDGSTAAASPAQNDKCTETTEGVADSSSEMSENSASKPIISINIPEETVNQQDFVDMYMKSMQQFTESLAKMKLPMEVENSSPTSDSANSSSEKKMQDSNGKCSRVFYGSRAFF
ncbi:uncharacterized protein [Typha latifolia]|uniref:uncharacterized protein isoform X1 n=1 Tax=Typha latifolia TaxID=4733 RepID=UPI003C2B6225